MQLPGWGGVGGWDEQTRSIARRMDGRQGSAGYSTGHAIQYAVINHNGKEHEKEHTHTQSQFAGHQKLAHCKSTLCQENKDLSFDLLQKRLHLQHSPYFQYVI